MTPFRPVKDGLDLLTQTCAAQRKDIHTDGESDWFRLRQQNGVANRPSGQRLHRFEPIDDFRMTLQVTVLSPDSPDRALDGSVFPYVGLRFRDEVIGPGF